VNQKLTDGQFRVTRIPNYKGNGSIKNKTEHGWALQSLRRQSLSDVKTKDYEIDVILNSRLSSICQSWLVWLVPVETVRVAPSVLTLSAWSRRVMSRCKVHVFYAYTRTNISLQPLRSSYVHTHTHTSYAYKCQHVTTFKLLGPWTTPTSFFRLNVFRLKKLKRNFNGIGLVISKQKSC